MAGLGGQMAGLGGQMAALAGQTVKEKMLRENLYGSSLTFSLDTLRISPDAREIAMGSYGSIYKGTLRCRYSVRHQLYRGIWRNESDPVISYRHCLRELQPTVQALEDTIPVAVKRVQEHEDQVEVVMREACNVRVLQGARNVVSVYGVTRIKQLQSVCIVMDMVEGPDLNKFLRSHHPPVPCASWWKTKLEIFMELVIGVSVCHRQGVYHGDLKGENIILDEFRVPKIIDFGMSFRRKDTAYLKSPGGSLFWLSPEILDAEEDMFPEEVLRDPYPSDVYSLGMVLVEMFLDGEVPAEVSSGFMLDKLQGGSPQELQVPAGMDEFQTVFATLIQVVDECCTLEREERISLENCLVQVQAAYNELCDIATKVDSDFLGDDELTSSETYKEMLTTLATRFRNVPAAVFRQPAKNMMVDIEGNLLVHLFCRLDFGPGVEFIIQRGMWNFKPEKDVPYMCSICVKEGSLEVLKLLGRRWYAIVLQEEWLVHEACDAGNVDVLRFLLSDMKMNNDTWDRIEQLQPSHKLAYQGKIEMMKVILESAPGNVNAKSLERTSLSYAIEGDQIDTVLFLLEKGGTLGGRRKCLLKRMLKVAIKYGSLRVITGLLEISSYYRKRLLPETEMKRYREVLRVLKGQKVWNFHNYENIEAALPLLKDHLKESDRRGLDPFTFACSKHGNQAVFKIVISFLFEATEFLGTSTKLCSDLVRHGTTEMAAYALERSMENLDESFERELMDEALEQGNEAMIEFLRERKGEEASGSRHDGIEADATVEEELLEAVEVGNIGIVADKMNSFLLTLGRISYREGHLHILNLLERHGLSLKDLEISMENAADAVAGKELREAVESGNFKFVANEVERLLADLGRICCKAGHLETLQLLEQHGLDIVLSNCLHSCAYYGELNIANYLLMDRGVPVDSRSSFMGSTPLMRALDGQQYEVAQRLLEAGADPNFRDDGGYTTMDRAIGFNNGKLIRLLVDYGFDVGMKNNDNDTYMDLMSFRKTSESN